PLFEWYVSCPEFEVRGAGFPGSPNLLVGGTAGVEDPTYVPVAWSMCGAASDLGDCFELALNQDGTQYRFGSGFDPIVSRPEPIIVKNPPGTTPPMRTEPFTVQETFWGPIIPELESRTAYVSGRRRAEGLTGPEAQAIIDDPNEVIPRYAFTDATGLIGPTSRASAPEIPFLAHDRMYRSSGIDEFLTAVREDYSYPAANMTIAAGDGQIGFTITGAIPVRRPAPEVVNPNQAQLRRKWAGRLPMKARWVGNRWQEFMPPELRPFGKNPAKGYFHNGNQSGVFFDHPLACYYASPSGDGERSFFLRRYVDRKIAEGAGTMQRADLEALSQSRQREVGPLVAKLI
ncbi:MAG: penicillin acylase family protein, partial [Planctomycetota bacterium]